MRPFRSLLLLWAAVAASAAGATHEPPLLRIVYSNDFHGYLEADSAAPHTGGAAHMAAMVSDARGATQPPALLVDAGDVFFGAPPISQLLNGTSTLAVWNAIKYAVCVVGNHEFDRGQATLAKLIRGSSATWLGANVVVAGAAASEWKQPDWLQPYALRTVGGVRVGIIGVVTDETPYITMRGNVQGLVFRPPTEAILHYWEEVASVSDLVVVLAHVAIEDTLMSSTQRFLGAVSVAKAVAAAGRSLPLFIAAHDHRHIHPPIVIGSTLITETGCHGAYYGFAEVSKSAAAAALGGLHVNITQRRVDDTTVPVPDAEVAELVAKYAAEVQPLVELVIGRLEVDLVRDYSAENTMGDLVCDSMLWQPTRMEVAKNRAVWSTLHDAVHSHPLMAQHPSVFPGDGVASASPDVCFMNPGGLRANLYTNNGTAANVTWGDTFKVLPFQNTLCTLKLTGTQIVAILTHSAEAFKGMLSVAGVTFEYWNASGQAAGVQNVLIGGKPVVASSQYLVVTNNFLAGGGDGWGFDQGVDITDTGVVDQDALNNYITGPLHGVIDANSIVGGRAKRIDPPSSFHW